MLDPDPGSGSSVSIFVFSHSEETMFVWKGEYFNLERIRIRILSDNCSFKFDNIKKETMLFNTVLNLS